MEYNINRVHFRDIYGKFLWAEDLPEEHRLHSVGETFQTADETNYKVEREAIVESVHHVNISIVEEDVNIVEPYL